MVPLPPGLLTTVTGTSTSLRSIRMRATTRAVRSVLPPGPDGATISTPRSGFQSAAAAKHASGATQPMEQEWNPSGYLWNVVQTVRVEVMPMTGAMYRNTCLNCHGDELMRGQKLTRAQWEREVEKMMRWGAQVPADQKAGLVDYLAARYKP